jgi:hypothetical protein
MLPLSRKIIIIVCALNALFSAGNAQFGVRVKYNNQSLPGWEPKVQLLTKSDQSVLKSGYEAGMDYWFRLKKRRVEFMPELAYGYGTTTFNNSQDLSSLSLRQLWANMHIQLYALDLEGDCNCPTFSKQGSGINKGLFFHITPGIGWYQSQAEYTIGDTYTTFNNSGSVFRIGGGIGLDMGFSDLLTVTPQISYYLTSEMTSILNGAGAPSEETTASYSRQLQFSLRFGFRPDYGRSGRYR